MERNTDILIYAGYNITTINDNIASMLRRSKEWEVVSTSTSTCYHPRENAIHYTVAVTVGKTAKVEPLMEVTVTEEDGTTNSYELKEMVFRAPAMVVARVKKNN